MTDITAASVTPAATPLQMSRVIKNTVAGLRQNAGAYLGLAVVFSGLPSLVGHALFAPAMASAGQWDSVRLSYYEGAIEGVFSYPLTAAVILGVVAHLRGQTLGVKELWSQGLKLWGTVFAISFILNLRIGIGLLLLIVPGVIWGVTWAAAIPVKVIEKRPLSTCLARSSALTKGSRWLIAGLLLIFVASILAAVFLIGLVGGLVVGAMKLMAIPLIRATQQIVSALISMATDLIGAAGLASLYFELKTNKEGEEPATVAAVFS